MSNYLSNFYDRLKKLRNDEQYPSNLLECISKKDLNQILDKLISDKKLMAQLQTLPASSAIRLPKNITKLSRTIAISRDPEGQFLCFLETKSKNAENKKRKVEEFDGGFKSGKPAWRLDGIDGPTPYASLIVEIATKTRKGQLSPAEQIEKLKKEIAYPWQVPENDFLLRSVQGPLYTNKKGMMVGIYSPLGIPLIDRKKHGLKLSKQDKDDIALQLLEGMCFMHQLGDIHQDIKPGNVILFIDENKKIKAKFIDFASICGNEASHPLLSTIGYESPEIALAHTNKEMPDYQHYVKAYKKEGRTLAKKYADQIEQRYMKSKNKAELDALKKEYKRPAFANDVWACGILLYELYHQNFTPKSSPKEELFIGMLSPDRSKRFTAEQALAAFNRLYRIEVKAPNTFLPSFQNKKIQEKEKTLIEMAKEAVNNFCHAGFYWIDNALRYFSYPTSPSNPDHNPSDVLTRSQVRKQRMN